MPSKAVPRLSSSTQAYLASRGHTVVVATVAADGRPDIDLISWVMPVDETTIRFAIGAHHPAAQNIQGNGRVTLQVLGKDQVCAIKGRALVLKPRMEATKFPQVLFEMAVEEARDNMYGAGMVEGDVPVRRDDRVEAIRIEVEKAVYAEIRGS
ncbi:MAG: pyridoxamine 5'-phosphate oxidase family protein [Anaerolineales bacterium]|nr:pyridoxamine 5'-phosphate oxidase family protein [Anaerolineales bacterium]